jgi:hypothetical protein
MAVLLTLATAFTAGWIIDWLAFRGELSGMVRDEVAVVWSRRMHPQKSQRKARRRGGH